MLTRLCDLDSGFRHAITVIAIYTLLLIHLLLKKSDGRARAKSSQVVEGRYNTDEKREQTRRSAGVDLRIVTWPRRFATARDSLVVSSAHHGPLRPTAWQMQLLRISAIASGHLGQNVGRNQQTEASDCASAETAPPTNHGPGCG